MLQFRRATALADKLLIKTAKVTRPKTVADYLAAAPKDRRAALARFRKTIKAAAPMATEGISYSMAGYKHKGRSLVYFGYWKDHVALYATGSEFIKTHAAELKPYVQSKGTLQFPLDRPLPYGLVARIVRSRIAKIEESPTMKKVASVDEFLAGVPADKRAALKTLRAAIRAAAPTATEGISYGVPTFKLDGRPLVSYGLAKAHCSFYLMSYAAMRSQAAALHGYKLGKGSVQFPADKPLPATLVRKLVKARIAEVRAAPVKG